MMGFDHNPYRHLEIVAAPEAPDCEPIRLARAMLGVTDPREAIPTTAVDEARRALAAGYTPPQRVPELPASWVWFCHNCGGKGRDAHTDLARLVADWVGHLVASHNASPSEFVGWSEV